MIRLFDSDNKVTSCLNILADLMMLNVLTIIGCIPVITIGVSITAMHYVLLKIYRKEEPSIIKLFFYAYKSNFKQATTIGCMYIIVALIIGFDISFLVTEVYQKSFLWTILLAILVVASYLVLSSLCWCFVLMSRYQNSIRKIVVNSFTLSLLKPVTTVTMIGAFILPFIVIIVFPSTMPFLIFVLFSLAGYLQTIFYNRIFKEIETVG